MNHQELQDKINRAAKVIGKTWPLYSFVTANPLSGYEDYPFLDAIEEAGNLWGARVLPKAQFFRQAWEEGDIGAVEIKKLLQEAGKKESPEYYLNVLAHHGTNQSLNENHELDRLTVKWSSLFLDEGMAEWPMPFKDLGFYTAWRKLIIYDEDLKKKITGSIPKSPEEALTRVLENFNQEEQRAIFERHLTALPGWAGFIKYRVENNSNWNKEYPITLLEFLAVRLWMARCLQVPILPQPSEQKDHSLLQLKYLWLQAWEHTWQNKFIKNIKKSASQSEEQTKPRAQLVFCLDSRSEVLRRHIEKQGNYETFGSAGSFGLPVDYLNPENGLVNKSSPAMVTSKYLVHEKPRPGQSKNAQEYKSTGKRIDVYKYFLKRMKNILPSAFGFVETAGYYYAFFLLLRIFKPNSAERFMLGHHQVGEDIYDPHLRVIEQEAPPQEISLEEQVQLVKGAFDSCGWRSFAPLVVFTGHASHSANNPYASSLDCGACAGNPGKRNARALARLCNSKKVQRVLRQKHDIDIPEDTIFIAAEHITSSDEVHLFDAQVPESHQEILFELQENLVTVQEKMTRERLNEPKNAVELAKTKSNSWSEARPEWGLSGHAGYIIGPRSLSINGKFSDCFLSSYDWQIDKEGTILKGIMQGPLLVCQWISNHYYFSTVDNEIFGGGSKIIHNITGKYGVMQGNGSDLKMGLPLQSLMKTDDKVYHSPIRLSTFIQAPPKFINQILESDKKLKSLLDNGWIHLFIIDPEDENRIKRYNP